MAPHGLDIAWQYAPPDAGRSALTSTYADFALARAACGAAGNYWECVGHLSWRPINAAYTMLETRVEDGHGNGMDKIDVAVCQNGAADVECTMPWATGTTDESGLVTLNVPLPNGGRPSFIKATSSATSPIPILPGYFYEPWPLTEARTTTSYGRLNGDQSGVPAVTYTESDASSTAAMSSGITLDPKRGTVAVSVQDCLGVRAPGVEVTWSAVVGGMPLATDPNFVPVQMTGSMGGILFLNVPEGFATVTAQLPQRGPLGKIGVYVHKAAYTLIVLRPTPL
jgi:hypothetical protein